MVVNLIRRTFWRIEIFLRIVWRPYDCLPDSFIIDPGLAWTFAKILAGDGTRLT